MSGHDAILFRRVRVQGRLCDVLIDDGHIVSVARAAAPTAADPTGTTPAEVVDGDGAALLPGLHDHHIHLAALAASLGSVDVGPPAVTTPTQFAAALSLADTTLAAGRWIRAVGYHESVAGPLDRDLLDRLVPARPARVQDRSGLRWTLNSAGLELVGAADASHPGIARDHDGRPTGAVDRGDDWIRSATGGEFPDLTPVGRSLAALGITGLTDCTPYGDLTGPSAIAAAIDTGALPQNVYVTGGVDLIGVQLPPPLHTGPVKVLLDEPRLPELSDLVEMIRHAHGADRSVAVHVVTAATLAFALAAWGEAGARPGDRIEHGSVITPAAIDPIARMGLTVVTQPSFVAERGDRYLAEVEDDHHDLYRCATLLERGVPVAGSSDAPYALPDPWRAIEAAVTRRTAGGEVLGPDERLPVDRAYDLFTGAPLDPGRGHRRVEPGAPADLVLLHGPLDASALPRADDVRATYRGGRLI